MGEPAVAGSYAPTAREREVIEYIAEGLTYEAMGRRMNVATDTVKTWSKRIFRKASVGNQAALIHLAWLNGHLGDRLELQAENEMLRNRADNLQAMYLSAIAWRGDAHRRRVIAVLEQAEGELRKVREAFTGVPRP